MEEEEDRLRERCMGCLAKIKKGYKGTMLCKDCYDKGERKTQKLKLKMRCFGCGERTTGYKKTWLCRSCYRELERSKEEI